MQNRGGSGPNETRNVLLAIVLSLAIFFGFEVFYNGPERERLLEAQRQREATEQAQAPTPAPTAGAESAEAPPPQGPANREEMLASSAASRVVIDTPSVDGSISLIGARIDDLNLRNYRRTADENSPEVTLLAPMNTEFGHDAFFGWEVQAGSDVGTLADASTEWTAPEGARLTPTSPVTLTRQAGENLTIERTISIDENFMFTITDTVRNASGAPVSVRPFGVVRRHGMPQDYRNNAIVHQGLIGAFGPENRLQQANFNNARTHARDKLRGRTGEDERIEAAQGEGGWFGIAEHYWLTAIVPDQNEGVSAYFDSRPEGDTIDYRTAYRGEWREAAPGAAITYTQRLFAGAKEYELLNEYQNGRTQERGDVPERDLGAPIPRFDDAIDWGNFWFLTRPFFAMMHWFGERIGGAFAFGFAILLSTIVIKIVLFPLVYHSFKAMAKMRGLAPKMKEVQERYAADKQRQQQEILRLYQTEKINPVSGCMPILLQIPVFFALYKVLTNTIEMRHAPFPGWINDLSAPDPTSIFNLFGVLPAIGFDFHSIPLLGIIPAIGVWPILYGVSMWALQALSPPPTDPIQAQIFRLLPILFTFMFATFPAGLVIYWTWSNTLSILQQYVIMRRQGVETQLDTWLKKRFGGAAAPAE